MALATLQRDREPEVARFIDTYKYDQDMTVRRDRFGGGTSLPLNSDGYEEKQQVLRDERHKDWLVQQDKPNDPVYYRVGTPEQGFPGLGEYEKQRQENNLIRQKDYNDMIKKQRQVENQKIEARRHAPPARPAQPPGPQMDYNLAGEQAKAEEKRAYQDYMGNYQIGINVPQRPLMDYWENQKVLKEERRREYNELMEKKSKEERYWAMRGRPVTPPGGLNIGNYDRQVKEQAQAKKQEYKKMLDEQQKEHMFLRARQEPEMAVLDRHGQPSQYLANKPPPGPSYGRGREEPSRQTPAFWNEGKQAQGPRSLNSDATRSNRSSAYIPMAFKTESHSRPIPERPTYGQPPYPGVSLNQNDERLNTDAPAMFQPRSPEKPIDREFLKVPMRDDERPQELGTPLAFKTNSYSRQPPPAPEEGYSRQPAPALERDYSRQPPPAPEQGYSRQPPSPRRDQGYGAPPFSSDNQKSFRKYENGPEGLFGRPDESRERPRSRRSLDADRKYSPTKRENVAIPANQISPRRMKNALYTDSEEVSTKRREASKERQKEYNDLLRKKAEKKRQDDDMFRHQQQQSKPAEVVKNPFYSSDDYEKFHKELQRKQGEEYREFLSQQYRPGTDAQGLPLGQYRYEPKRLQLEAERNKEYNQVLQKQLSSRKPKDIDKNPQGLNIDANYHHQRQAWLERQRNKDYNDHLRKQKITNPGRRHDFVDTANGPYNGLFHGLGEHGTRGDDLNRERQKEYNDKLEKQYAGKDRPSGRPTWAQDSLPNNTDRGRSPMKTQPPADQYQQMLNEKRREEANLRRFEDPEYQERLSRGRDRGDAGQRYGY